MGIAPKWVPASGFAVDPLVPRRPAPRLRGRRRRRGFSLYRESLFRETRGQATNRAATADPVRATRQTGSGGPSAAPISGRYCPLVTNDPPAEDRDPEEPEPEEPEPEEPEPEEPEPKYSKLHLRRQPVDHAAHGGVWPYRELLTTAPPAAHLLRGIARRLAQHQLDNDWTLEKIESLTHANVSSLSRLLRGEAWGSAPIIAQLERHLDIDLWGDEHRKHKLP